MLRLYDRDRGGLAKAAELGADAGRDRVTVDADVSDNAKPLLGLGCPLCELAGRMRKAAADLEFEEAARLRDAIKRLKMLDPEFANEALTPEGKQLDRNASKLARAGAAEWYRRGDGESAACR